MSDWIHWLEAWLSGYNTRNDGPCEDGEAMLAEAQRCFERSGSERAKRRVAAASKRPAPRDTGESG